jgi:hypothetical protein
VRPQTIYSWGPYEEQLYIMYAKPDEDGPAKQIELFQAHLATTEGIPPPGFHAQLGYLYFISGKFEEAHREFNNEKSRYPESATFMNRRLAKIDHDD